MTLDHAVTERYLARLGRMRGPVSDTELSLAYTGGKYASRPVFFPAAAIHRLCRDLEVLRGALFRLPELLFGGDLAAFAAANGMDKVQTRAIERASAGVPDVRTSMGRADLYVDQSGFRVLEFNLGSTIGYDSGDIGRGFLEDPEFSRFAAEEGLQHIDTLTEQVRTFRQEMGLAPDDRPFIAHVEWPKYYEKCVPYMDALCKRWQGHGLDVRPCHIGQLERRDGRLWLEDRPVDIVYRQFMMEDLVDDNAAELLEPLLGAVESGEVRMFTSLESELYGSKASLAMLSNRAHRDLFSETELDVIDRLLPWTCSLTAKPGILPDGTEGSLLDYAVANQAELVLKPTLLHGGHGVVPGWSSKVTPETWREMLVDALDGPYVLQSRIHPVPELFGEPDGGFQPWIVAWGVVTMASGYAGVMTRCARVGSGVEVLNFGSGVLVGSGFPVGPDA